MWRGHRLRVEPTWAWTGLYVELKSNEFDTDDC